MIRNYGNDAKAKRNMLHIVKVQCFSYSCSKVNLEIVSTIPLDYVQTKLSTVHMLPMEKPSNKGQPSHNLIQFRPNLKYNKAQEGYL